MLSVKGGLKLGFAAPRLLRTSRLLNCCSAHQNRPNSRVAVKGLSGADAPKGSGEDSSTPSSAHFSSSTSNTPDEGKPDEDTQDDGTPGEGTDPREDFIRFLWPKIRTLDFGLAKEVYDNYAARIPYSSGLDALEQISAADWLLQWGEGYHQVSEGLPRPLRFWSAWRIYAAYNAKKRGDVAPFPAPFLARLPKDIFDNELKVTQSKKKQQALFTIHMVSLLRFPGAYFKAEHRGEGDVMKELQFTLSRDPWALMMKQSTFTFREMEAVADKFGADLSSPSRGVAALLSKLKEKCNNFKVTHMTWPKLEEETSALLGAKFKTPLKHCMAKLLDGEVVLESFGTALDPSDASKRSWEKARCFLRNIYDAEITNTDFALARLMENHSTPLAAQISEARAAKQHLESGGVGPCKVHPHVSPLQEIVLNAVPFKESDAVVAYPDNAIQEARKMQAASEKPYKELCMQLRSELRSVRFQKKFLVRKDEDDETQDYNLTVLRGDEVPSMEKLESLVMLGQAMERLAAAETLLELQLDKKQHQALIKAATNQVLILTGAAGCGKTYATYAIVTYFRSLGMAMHLMAPTGRAASNMRSMTGEDASTIHSALRATPLDSDEEVYTFRGRGEHEKLGGVVIVDETSMVDLVLMSEVIKAQGEGSRLILVGDVEQLPPVSIGAPFQDLVAWNKLPAVYLDQVHRQKACSTILNAAHQVLQGKKLGAGSGMKFLSLSDIVTDVFEPASIDGSEFSKVLADIGDPNADDRQRQVAMGLAETLGSDAAVVEVPSGCKESEALGSLRDLVTNLRACGADPQVISPATSKKFGLSVDAVNKSLHPIMNDNFYKMSKDWRLQRLGFCKGDRIVQVRNDSDNGLANGDQGVVEQVTFDEDEKQRLSYTVSVDFTPVPGPGEKRKLVKYVVSSRSDLENHLRQAWSISVHKAQGGGFPIVVLFLHESMGGNLRMPMLYTAITRASGLLLILSTNAALTTKMIESKKAYDTTLMQRLKKLAN